MGITKEKGLEMSTLFLKKIKVVGMVLLLNLIAPKIKSGRSDGAISLICFCPMCLCQGIAR